MKEVKFEPSDCKGENAAFEGHVLFKKPTFIERIAYSEAAGIGEVGEDGKAGSNLSIIRKLAENVEKHVVAVNLKRKSDGVEFKTFDDLNLEEDCSNIMLELCGLLIKGFGAEKK